LSALIPVLIGMISGIGLIVTFAIFFNEPILQYPISQSQGVDGQAPVGHILVTLSVSAWDLEPSNADEWINSHPEFIDNLVILDDSMLVRSSALEKAVQWAVEHKQDHEGAGVYMIEPLPPSDLISIERTIGASKFIQGYATVEDNYNEKGEVKGKAESEESHALVKYGTDYLTVSINKIVILS
jgi:hypothetical protein